MAKYTMCDDCLYSWLHIGSGPELEATIVIGLHPSADCEVVDG